MLRAVPRSLLMTFFGAFLRRLGGWIAVADLVALMGDLGLDEQAVRSAVSRLKRRGVIAPERRGGRRRLPPHAARRGDPRGRRRADLRPRRRGRRRLAARRVLDPRGPPRAAPQAAHPACSGSGSARSPPACGSRRRGPRPRCGASSRELDARRATSSCSAGGTSAAARRSPRGGTSARSPPSTAPTSRRGSRRSTARGRATDAAAFAGHVGQLDAWRRIPFHDPGLPAAVLPEDWPGAHAWDVFRALDRRLGARRCATSRRARRAERPR